MRTLQILRARAYLTKLLNLVRRPPSVPQIDPVASAREAYAEGDIDRAYALAINLPSSFDRTALLLRCAHEMSTLGSAQTALESIESLSAPDHARLDQTLLLSRIRNSLTALGATALDTTIAKR